MAPQQSNDVVDSPGKELSVEDMIDELSKDDVPLKEDESESLGDLGLDKEDDEVDDKKLDKKDKEDDEKEEDEKLELKLEDEDLELIAPPRRAEILKAYPDLFKKFPYIEKAMYREQALTEIVGTLDDAKEIKERAGEYGKFESDLLEGNISGVFTSLKTSDPDAFGQVVDNLLPTLYKVDQNAYNHIIGDVIKRTLISAVKGSKSLGEEDGEQLKLAASLIHQFVFGPGEFVPPKKFGKEVIKNPDEEKVKAERNQLTQERFNYALGELEDKTDNLLKRTIDSNIDPKNVMSRYIKRTAINDSMDLLKKLVNQDTRFQQFKDKLWEKAFNENFSPTIMGQIRSAYLSKAKTLLPAVIRKVRAEALGSHSQNNKQDEERPRNRDNKLTSDKAKKDEKNKVPKGMTSYEFLSQD